MDKRLLIPLIALVGLAGCDSSVSLIGTWNGELPEGQSVKTPKGDFRPNLVLDLKADHSFHATVTSAVLDGRWTQQGQTVVLDPDKATINGQDVSEMRKKLELVLPMLPASQREALEAYDPTKPWELKIQNAGKTLYLPSRGQGIAAFTFRKAM